MRKIIVGVDISKVTLDIAILAGDKPIRSVKINNTEKDLLDFLKQLRGEYRFKAREIAVCAEQMGLYAKFLTSALARKKIDLYLESPLQIKKSLGIQRGKNDRLDAVRIAQYAKKHIDAMKVYSPPRLCIQELRQLITLRKRLVKAEKLLITSEKDATYYLKASEVNQFKEYYKNGIAGILQDIKNVESKIKDVIKDDVRLSRLFLLVTSVPRIGFIIGIEFIALTNEFTEIDNPKKFATLSGVAPFQYQSGSSVSGKTKVSGLARKDIKALLHIAAMGVVQMPNTFLCKYYLRKVGEGKNKMSVLNAIRNKIIHRVFACVREDIPFKE